MWLVLFSVVSFSWNKPEQADRKVFEFGGFYLKRNMEQKKNLNQIIIPY